MGLLIFISICGLALKGTFVPAAYMVGALVALKILFEVAVHVHWHHHRLDPARLPP